MTQPIETVHLDRVIANHTRNMTGRLAVITGTTSGTGYVCAREMAKRGAIVVLLNRESVRSASSMERLQADVPGGEFHAVTCDLQHFGSVRSAIKLIRSNTDRIDVLCNNAGVMALPDEATRDGYDVQMQTNCLSHFLLTKALFDLLLQSDDARIVNHTSMARIGGPLEAKYFRKNGGNLGGDGDDPGQGRIGGPRWERYHQSKLANCAFTYGLKHRLEKAGIHNVKALLAHPGLARTQLHCHCLRALLVDAAGNSALVKLGLLVVDLLEVLLLKPSHILIAAVHEVKMDDNGAIGYVVNFNRCKCLADICLEHDDELPPGFRVDRELLVEHHHHLSARTP